MAYKALNIKTGNFNHFRVVVEPARGQARGSHRDRYNDGDRYSSRRGGGRYNSDK